MSVCIALRVLPLSLLISQVRCRKRTIKLGKRRSPPRTKLRRSLGILHLGACPHLDLPQLAALEIGCIPHLPKVCGDKEEVLAEVRNVVMDLSDLVTNVSNILDLETVVFSELGEELAFGKGSSLHLLQGADRGVQSIRELGEQIARGC